MRRALSVLLALALLLCAPLAAFAQTFGGVASFVESGPIRLDPSGAGRFSVKNTGAEALHVNTLYGRTNERDPRLPGTLHVAFEGGGTKADLAPGEARVVTVKWDHAGARLHQLFGHVVVESSDRSAPQRAIGVTASHGGFVREHLATLLVLLPLLGALLILPLGSSRRFDEKNARWIALVSTGAMAALLLFAARGFDPQVTRLDGNEGLQFVERARLFGAVDWYLGIDGASLPLLGALAVAAFLGVLVSFHVERHHEAFFASYLGVVAAAAGALLAVDAMLLTLFAATAWACGFALALRFGGDRGRPVAVRLALFGGLAVAALAALVLGLHRASDPTFLLDGARGQSFALGELARTDWVARTEGGALLFGKPFLKGAIVVLFVAAAVPLAVAPLHGFLSALFAEVHAGAVVVIGAATSLLGAHLWLRFGVLVMPAGVRWAAPALAMLGAATVVWGALAALGERDLRRALAHVSVAHGGLVLLAVAACTPQAIGGVIAHAAARAIALAGLLAVAGALHERVRTSELARFGGLVADTPLLAALGAVAFLGAAIAPGTASFASTLLILSGSFPSHRGATALACVGLVLLALACVSLYRRLFLGPLDEAWRQSADLEPFGGRFPDANRRERLALALIVALIVLGGLWPRLWLGLSRGTIDDLDARVNPEKIAALAVESTSFEV